jgi:hypothetical protein
MIVIDNVIIGDEVVSEQFVCNLSKCKGGCCEDGDAGAPLEETELDELKKNYAAIEPYLTEEGAVEIKRQGLFVYDNYFGWVTPTVNKGICAYACRNKNGIIKCAIEQAYNDGKLDWKKPVSCHLYPIRIQQSKTNKNKDLLNYEPREELCSAACKLGKLLKTPVYRFLREPLIRKYGAEFYEAMEATAEHLQK